MPKFKPLTVGQLRKMLEKFDDNTPVVVDGYEGGLSTPAPPRKRRMVLFGASNAGYYGAHKEVWNKERDSEAVDAVCLSRGGGHAWEELSNAERKKIG